MLVILIYVIMLVLSTPSGKLCLNIHDKLFMLYMLYYALYLSVYYIV